MAGGQWDAAGPDVTGCKPEVVPKTDDLAGLYDNWPAGIAEKFKSQDLIGVLEELQREIDRRNPEGIVQLVDNVAKKLVRWGYDDGDLNNEEFLKVGIEFSEILK